MKKSILLSLLLSIASVALWAQDETRDLNDFESLSVATGIDAKIVKGTKSSIEITATGVDMDKIITEVKNGHLKVYIKKKWWSDWGRKTNVDATITYTSELDGISSSSGASVSADHTIVSDELEVSASSGADLMLDVEVRSLDASVSSGADMELEGEAQIVEVDASSGASFKGGDLVCEKADLDVSSGAGIRIEVTEELVADASSGGSIKYRGNPSKKDIDKSSGGSVRARN